MMPGKIKTLRIEGFPLHAHANERLIEFYREGDHSRWLCELHDHGPYGVEVRFYRNVEFLCSRRFDPRLDPTRPPREMAVQWAELERQAIERDA